MCLRLGDLQYERFNPDHHQPSRKNVPGCIVIDKEVAWLLELCIRTSAGGQNCYTCRFLLENGQRGTWRSIGNGASIIWQQNILDRCALVVPALGPVHWIGGTKAGHLLPRLWFSCPASQHLSVSLSRPRFTERRSETSTT